MELYENFVKKTVFKTKKFNPVVLQKLNALAGEGAEGTFQSWAENNMLTCLENLLPMPVKSGKKTAFEVVKNFAADLKELRVTLRGVFHDQKNNTAVATDGKTLAFCAIPEGYSGAYGILSDDGSQIDGVFPDWQKVVPKNPEKVAVFENIPLAAGIIASVDNFSQAAGKCAGIGISGSFFDCKKMRLIFETFLSIGETSVTASCCDGPVSIWQFSGKKSGLNVVILNLRNLDNIVKFDFKQRYDMLTVENLPELCSFDVCGEKVTGTFDHPLKGLKYTASDIELGDLLVNVLDYQRVIGIVLMAALRAVIDVKYLCSELRKIKYEDISTGAANIHADFEKIIRKIKTPEDCRAAAVPLWVWMEEFNSYIDQLLQSGTGGRELRKFDIENLKKIFAAEIQNYYNQGKITIEDAAAMFLGGAEELNSYINIVTSDAAALEKQKRKLESSIPEGSGIYIFDNAGKLWFRHPKCGDGLFKSIEEIQAELCRIEKKERADRLREIEEKERAEKAEKLRQDKENLHGFQNTMTGIKRARALSFLYEVTPYCNSDIRGKRRREVIELYISQGFTPHCSNYDGKEVYSFRKSIGDGCNIGHNIDTKTEYEYACFLHANNILTAKDPETEIPSAQEKEIETETDQKSPLIADVPEVRSRYFDKLINMLTAACDDNDFYKCNILICRYMELHTLPEYTYLRNEFHQSYWQFLKEITVMENTKNQICLYGLSRDMWDILKTSLPPEDYSRIYAACERYSAQIEWLFSHYQDKFQKDQLAEKLPPEKIIVDLGHSPGDIQQILEAEKKASFTLNDKKISQKKAIELLGKRDYWSGIGRAAFHWSSGRFSPAGNVSIDCRRYFRQTY